MPTPKRNRSKPLAKVLIAASVLFLIGAGCATVSPKTQDTLYEAAMSLETRLSHMQEHSAQLGDYKIEYLRRDAVGDKAGTIVLLHGFTADKTNWLRFVRGLPKNYEVIAPDWPAHGASTYIEGGDYRIGTQADRLAALLAAGSLSADQLSSDQLSSVHLVGHSMGGAIAANFASRYPKWVKSLTLMNAGGVDDADNLSDLERELQTTGNNPLLVKKPGDMKNTLNYAMSKPPFIPWPLTQVLERESINRAPRFAAVFEQITDGVTSTDTDYLTQISAPTLILWGDQDRLLHVANSAIFKRSIPSSQLIIYPGIGHMPMLEIPKISSADVAKFVTSIDAANSNP